MKKKHLKSLFTVTSFVSFIVMLVLTTVALIAGDGNDIVAVLYAHVTVSSIFIVSCIGLLYISNLT